VESSGASGSTSIDCLESRCAVSTVDRYIEC
jgi:hypothetical protein